MEFSCVAVAGLLSYFVNGTDASVQSVIDKGFIQLGTEDVVDSTAKRKNLTTTALTKYNNTEIQCLANAMLHSDIGTLVVQGKLLLRPFSLY